MSWNCIWLFGFSSEPPLGMVLKEFNSRCSKIVYDLPGKATLCCLTFELSGRRRQDARPGLAKMYRVPPGRAWWPAVGAQLERGVRLHSALLIRLSSWLQRRAAWTW